jgi:hypothetical protein
MRTGLPKGAVVQEIDFNAVHSVGFLLRGAISGLERRNGALPEKVQDRVGAEIITLNTKRTCIPVAHRRLMDGAKIIETAALAQRPEDRNKALRLDSHAARTLALDAEQFLVSLNTLLTVAVNVVNMVEREVLHEPPTPRADLYRIPSITEAEQKLFHATRSDYVHRRAAWMSAIITGNHVDVAFHVAHTPDFVNGKGYVLWSSIHAVQKAVLRYIDKLEADLVKRVNRM